MSQENVEVARALWAGLERGDVRLDLCDEQIELRTAAEIPVADEYRGHDGVRQWATDVWEVFSEFHNEVEEVIDGEDRETVVTVVRTNGLMRHTGLEAKLRWAVAWTFRGGKALRAEGYLSKAEALEAAGFSEWENAEQRGLADAGFGALNSGDLEAFLALTAEDVEFTSMVAEAEGTTFRGHDGVRAWWETVRGAFEDVRWDLLDIRGSGDRGVMQFRMTGTLGSVPVEQTMWQAVVLRDGKLIWWAFFRSEHEALEAVGLRE
jgi:ketosteroid isomerase-like protein